MLNRGPVQPIPAIALLESDFENFPFPPEGRDAFRLYFLDHLWIEPEDRRDLEAAIFLELLEGFRAQETEVHRCHNGALGQVSELIFGDRRNLDRTANEESQ